MRPRSRMSRLSMFCVTEGRAVVRAEDGVSRDREAANRMESAAVPNMRSFCSSKEYSNRGCSKHPQRSFCAMKLILEKELLSEEYHIALNSLNMQQRDLDGVYHDLGAAKRHAWKQRRTEESTVCWRASRTFLARWNFFRGGIGTSRDTKLQETVVKASVLTGRGQAAACLRSASVAAEDVVLGWLQLQAGGRHRVFLFPSGECFW